MSNRSLGSIRKAALASLVGALTAGIGSGVVMAQVNIADAPLFLTSSIDPNIMFILDDSGSMHAEVMPDDYMYTNLSSTGTSAGWVFWAYPRATLVYGGSDYNNNVASFQDDAGAANNTERAFARLFRSPQVNTVYYNPAITYTPWVNADGSLMDPADPAAAYHNPRRTARGTRDLTATNTQNARWVYCSSSACTSTNDATVSRSFWPAVYFTHTGGSIWNHTNYTKTEIRSTIATYTGEGRTNRTDCAQASLGICTYDEEIQNFANWYQYYRSRILSARAGIGRAFVDQSDRMRVGFGAINKGSTAVDGVNTGTVIQGVRRFSGTNRDGFFANLYDHLIPNQGTPLRTALDDAGQYFSRTDNEGPWGERPGFNDTTPHLECRQSYTILMTDGYWSGGSGNRASTAGARLNVDGTDGAVISAPDGSTFQYVAGPPYSDSYSNTLADVAMYYWSRDLRPDLANRVFTSPQNEAFWQHMVTFGVGLGVTGSIAPATAWAAVETGSAIAWPDTSETVGNCSGAACAARLDDLLHAAVNSRGGFFSASDPETFARELSDVLTNIVSRVEAAGTAAATSSAVLQTDTLLYTASFRSTDWSGTLVAREVQPSGALGVLKFDTEQRLNTTPAADRNIFTLKDDGTGIALNWTLLGDDQQDALDVNPSATATTATGADRIQWLRGVEHAGLRGRTESGITRKIGSLIGSDPQFMFRRDFGSSRLPGTEGSSYRTFRDSTAYKQRPDVIFVGSNGGMLHAFHAGTPFIDDPNDLNTPPAKIMDPDGGKELFAYVPSELLLPRAGSSDTHAQINELMIPEYDHRYFVDGTATWRDAYVSGSWKTVLVGTMGAGGRTVFALDVTDPESFSTSKIMWEFGYADVDCDAGVTACREVGYGISQPSIARLTNGTWAAIFGNGYNSASHQAKLFIVELATGELINMIDTGVGDAASPNGLAPAAVTVWPADPNSPFSVTRAYAGDLQGNMWRFDLTGSMGYARLFSATDSGGAAQPITARPTLAPYPGDSGKVIVTFGTGSFFRATDNNTTQTQSLYGVFDTTAGQSNLARSDLQSQTIVTNGTAVTLGTAPNQRTYPAGTLRTLSSNAITTQQGWVVNLPATGERAISEATFPSSLIRTRVRFSTMVPNQDPCSSGREGFLMDFDLLTGGAYASSVFDLTGDGVFDSSDFWNGQVVSGLGGVVSGERITNLRREGVGLEYLYGGEVPHNLDCNSPAFANHPACNPPAGAIDFAPTGRQSWRQIR